MSMRFARQNLLRRLRAAQDAQRRAGFQIWVLNQLRDGAIPDLQKGQELRAVQNSQREAGQDIAGLMHLLAEHDTRIAALNADMRKGLNQ